MNFETLQTTLTTNALAIGLKLTAAIAMWIIGRWIIGLVMKVVSRAIERGGKIDATLSKYVTSILSVLLTIGLVVGILGYVGIQTTTFAALLAGAGLAIGTAWGGLMAHFAAGAFLQVLRPFKVGDIVSAGGVEGQIKEIGLFSTTFVSGDNVTITVGNNKIFSDSIKNYSALAFRRVDVVAKVANSVDVKEAISKLRPAIAAIKNVQTNPAPEIEILGFTPEGPQIAVRPFCHTDNYWQVLFETNAAIVSVFGSAGYPTPETPMASRILPAA
jgi:small conductance mechanosensitive channel